MIVRETLFASTLLMGLMMSTRGVAQIVVGASDLPQGGTTYTFQTVAPDILLDFESSGPGWVWDFSDIEPTETNDIPVLSLSEASFQAQFAFSGFNPEYQADHFYPALVLPDMGGAGGELGFAIEELIGYHQVGSGSYNQVGVGVVVGGFELPVPFEDVDEVHPVPLAVNADFQSTAAYEIQIPGTFTYVVDQDRNTVVDGYGTLLLPDGSTHEVLRMKSVVVSDDSVYIDLASQGLAFERETVTYSWVGDGGMPWMEVVTTFGVPSSMRYQEVETEPEPSGVGAPSATNEGQAFPNPVVSGSWIAVGGDEQTHWTVTTVSGSFHASTQGGKMSTQGWPKGLVVLINQSTGRAQKVVVQ